MSEVNETGIRTAAEIEAELEATRSQMTATVDELVAQLQPAHLVEMAKEDVSRRFADAKVKAFATVEAARDGDQDALRKIGVAAAAAVGVLSFMIWRFSGK